MATYGDIAAVKNWLPEVSGTTFDTELTAELASVGLKIDDYLRPYTGVPLSTIPTIIGDIAEQWCAGNWRARRTPDGKHEFITQAIKLLEQYIKSNFGGSDSHIKRHFIGTGDSRQTS